MKAKLLEMVGRVPVLGSTLRKLARRYPEGSVVTIGSGLAAGYRWRRHHRYVNGYWLGHYELGIQNAMKACLGPGQRVFDVGANAGFFTLVAAKLVGPTGKVVAFDPSPDNVASIHEQIELNALASCTVVDEAISDREGTATFSFAGAGSAQGHLGAAGSPGETSVEVPVTTLDAAADRFGNPDFIKMDIEGAEISAVAGAGRVLREARPTWLIELHGPACEAEVRRVLTGHGYTLHDLDLRPVDAAAPLPHHVIARAK